MNSSNNRNFERELPAGYRQAKYINAKNAKFGIIFNLIALIVLAIVVIAAFALLKVSGRTVDDILDVSLLELIIAYVLFFGVMIGYVVLHELVHGIAYKSLTGEKLTFGMSWSCAFCGVPHIYTYRRTAIIAVVSPFAVFSILFLAVLIPLYFISPLYFLIFAFNFGLHLGGCSGDLYVLLLFMTKFKDKKTLMRDTGPEQYFYVPEKALEDMA